MLPVGVKRSTSRPSNEPVIEQRLRQKLGIPSDAKQVLIFGETSHWDPNWLHTTDEYFEGNVRQVIDRAIEQLTIQPRRVFAIESLYFLQRYWDQAPGKRQALRQLLESGQLRLTGSGVTTPDTVLPDTEAIIRDYLYGQQWLRDNDIAVEPTVAYLPDDFGHTPALPSLLGELGYSAAAITRIDGMYFVAADFRPRHTFPLPGSSAEALQEHHSTLDFVWRAPDGAELLCHWNAFTYFQGDMLAHLGVIRWMGTCYGVGCRTDRHVARRVRRYVEQLQPLSRTPYMYCPIGCDFNEPIDDLVGLLDRYNERWYPETGVWVLNAGLDDYLQLVDCHRQLLPTIDLDPNPYWMGFYSSRPEAKRRCNRTVRKLLLAEKLSAIPSNGDGANGGNGVTERLRQDIRSAWDLVVLSNHHDFITGTSPDRIWLQEQLPWLQNAEALADRSLVEARIAHPPCGNGEPTSSARWSLHDGRLEVITSDYQAVVDERQGGCLVSFRHRGDDRELLAAPANDLTIYADSGGLWRMGHEYRGGRFEQIAASKDRPATLWIARRSDVLEVQVISELAGRPFVRWLWFRDGSPIVRMRVRGAAPKRRTVTCRFPTTIAATEVVMDVPGGVARRPLEKIYSPTFWPARSFVHLHNADRSPIGAAGFVGGPASIAASRSGELQWVAFRYAPKERAFGVLPLLAHPASGTAPAEGMFDYALWFTRDGDYCDNQLAQHERQALRSALKLPDEPDIDSLAASVMHSKNPQIIISAIKPADHGAGVIVRLYNPTNEPQRTQLRCTTLPVRKATLCDGLERDRRSLPVSDGVVSLGCGGSITSLRIEF